MKTRPSESRRPGGDLLVRLPVLIVLDRLQEPIEERTLMTTNTPKLTELSQIELAPHIMPHKIMQRVPGGIGNNLDSNLLGVGRSFTPATIALPTSAPGAGGLRNFTRPGLTRNIELNVQIQSTGFS